MYGTTLTRSLNAMRFMVRRPRDGVRWWTDRVMRKSPIELGVPWVSWPCIDYLRSHVKAGMKVLEWGGGGSTVFFAALGCEVTSVESNASWQRRIDSALKAHGLSGRVRSRLIECEGGDPALRERYVHAAEEGGPWDVILIDGWEGPELTRMDCARTAASCLSRDGMVVLDDAWVERYREAPVIFSALSRLEFWGLGPARLGVTKTDVYRAPG